MDTESPIGPLLHSTTAAQLAGMLQAAGCRASVIDNRGRREVHSAVQALGFFLRLGNPQPGSEACIDFTWVCPLAVRGELPRELIESWNRSTRFGHLSLQGGILVLSMESLLAGGVTEAHLRAQFEIWVRLLQQLHLHVRSHAAQGVQAAAA
ncbi:MAG: YbjN protein [Nevskia sp.]|nr:YbjN protein [Nevskia sp.]